MNISRRRLLLLLSSGFCGVSFSGQNRELRCRICGVLIPPDTKYYTSADGKYVYCARCFATAPRCSVCGLPTRPEEIDPETGACPACLAKLPRCKACGRPIVGTYYTYPYTDGVFCADCKNNTPACAVCGVPVGPDYYQYPDGRAICRDCFARAVFDVGEIERIVRDARRVVESKLGLEVQRPFDIGVDRLNGSAPGERKGSGTAKTGHGGLYGKELGLYRLSGGKSEIVLLFGLPIEILYETAAHEYAHAWQAEHCPLDLEPVLREGFAQWVAAEVLRAKGYRVALERLEARTDSPYGTGYQRLRRLSPRVIMKMIRARAAASNSPHE